MRYWTQRRRAIARPQEPRETGQFDFFRARLDQIIDSIMRWRGWLGR